MSRVLVEQTLIPRRYATEGEMVTFTAADTVDNNKFLSTGNEILLAKNEGVESESVTVNSTPGKDGRLGDIETFSIPAGETAVFQKFPTQGWRQDDDHIYLEATSADVSFAVLRVR